LVEREAELAQLAQRVRATLDGHGSTVVVEASAGKGKSSLLRAAEHRAGELGMQVLRASGSELERRFAFGAAIQLFEPLWALADSELRARLASGPARAAAALLDGYIDEDAAGAGERGYPAIRGLFWLARNWTSVTSTVPTASDDSSTPLLLIVDDAQWCDRPSRRFLAYLAARIERLPIMLLIGLRPSSEPVEMPALTALRHTRNALILRPASLSAAAVRTIVHERFPDAEDGFAEACATITSGNPFLLAELLAQIAEARSPADTRALSDLVPEAIVRNVHARLEAVSAPARALAQALAVLGDRVALADVARLAGLDGDAAASAAEALSDAHLLVPSLPLCFTHHLIRSAVLASMSQLARGRLHRLAAKTLRDAGGGAENIAAHLLLAPAAGDLWAVEELRRAAFRSLRSGDACNALRLLERALQEQPHSDLHRDIAAELALARGQMLLTRHQHRDAAAAFESGLHELGDSDCEPKARLEAGYVTAASLVPALGSHVLERRDHMLEQLDGKPDADQRLALAQSVIHDSMRGAVRDDVRRLAELAWDGGALLERGGPTHDVALASLTSALLFTDELERVLEICDAAHARAGECESPMATALIASCRAWALHEQGRVADALACATVAIDRPDQLETNIRTAYGAMACCRLTRGELDRAQEALMVVDDQTLRGTIRHAGLLELRAQLRLAQHIPHDALADAMRAGRALEQEFGVSSPGAFPWRSTAAMAHLALGNTNEAQGLASDELELARRLGLTRIVIRDLRVLGLAAGGAEGIELLQEAVSTASGYPQRLESIHAYTDLGAALRRAKKRAAARAPLRKALELAHRHEAFAAAERARTELAATGARPRRLLLSGVESLTPSERRVAELAAVGMTTRMIADSLFISPKTVEYHLRHIYQKLDVSSRDQLADAFRKQRTV
jgi:DNA-binding CsgD family transcriptional regulator